MPWSSQLHQIYSDWKQEGLQGRRLLLLFSGGADSTALFFVLETMAPVLKFEFDVLHFHHGGEAAFRREAAFHCEKISKRSSRPFHLITSAKNLSSEEEMREFRLEQLQQFNQTARYDRILLAHHTEDLLETQMMRLLRGTGLQGLACMHEKDNSIWRPFLRYSRMDLRDILNQSKWPWVEDPTNLDRNYERNWIRHELFPLLEARRPGSLMNLTRALSQVVELVDESSSHLPLEEWLSQGISRPWLMTQSVSSQKRVLAAYIHALGVRDYSHTQVDEIRKHLDKPQLHHTFIAASCEWRLSPDRVLALPRDLM